MKNTIILGMLTSLGFLSTASAATLFGVTTDNSLISFDSSAPSIFQTSVTITGLFDADGTTPNSNGSILNLTVRPGANSRNFQLWAIDNNANIYTINLGGAATLVSAGFNPAGFAAGFAHDPFNDNFVYAGDNAENFSLSFTGSATANPNLTYAGGGAASIFGLGIDPDFGTVFAVDAVNDSLSTSFDPNFPGASELTIVGGLNMDVASFGGLAVDFDGNLFASLSTDGISSGFYSVNKSTGEASLIGNFTTGLSAITAAPTPVPDGGTTFALLGGTLAGLGLLRRKQRHA